MKTAKKAAIAPETGAFLAQYRIGGNMPGAPLFIAKFVVSTPNQTVNGSGTITQAINPPLELHSRLSGDYTYMTVMPKNSHILVTATGYPQIKWPPNAGHGPVLLPNVHLRMVLNDDWQSGTANYSYLNSDGRWIDIKNAPVRAF